MKKKDNYDDLKTAIENDRQSRLRKGTERINRAIINGINLLRRMFERDIVIKSPDTELIDRSIQSDGELFSEKSDCVDKELLDPNLKSDDGEILPPTTSQNNGYN
jgi:hypothetical protein